MTLFNSFCDFSSETGFIYTEVFISPNKYISLNSSGKVHILGRLDTKKLLAYLVVLEIISKWSKCEASIPAGAISSFNVFFFNILGSCSCELSISACICSSSFFCFLVISIPLLIFCTIFYIFYGFFCK